MIPGYNVKEQWLGQNNTLAFNFDFTIQDPTHLQIYVQDNNGIEVENIRGNDTTYLAGVTFDSQNGGGTITLLAFLPQDYVLTIYLANDAPVQTSIFRNKFSFTLFSLELALDYIMCALQRVAFLGARSLRLHDLDDIDLFNPMLPLGASSNPNAILALDPFGAGIVFGPSVTSVAANAAAAIASAAAASTSAASASSSQTSAAASAAAAAASAAAATGGYSVSGTRGAPLLITALAGIVPAAVQRGLQFVKGSGGPVTITAVPPIAAGTVIGQELLIIGCDNANTLKISEGTGAFMNGDCTLTLDDTIAYVWDGTEWLETYRR